MKKSEVLSEREINRRWAKLVKIRQGRDTLSTIFKQIDGKTWLEITFMDGAVFRCSGPIVI